MDIAIRQLFQRYERFHAASLAGGVDEAEMHAIYASNAIGATPAGVMCASCDDAFRAALEAGFARSRAIGLRASELQNVHVTPIDAHHALARVGWLARYARDGKDDVEIAFDVHYIAFDVHYLVQIRDGGTRVFGWISGDEQALLQAHGIR